MKAFCLKASEDSLLIHEYSYDNTFKMVYATVTLSLYHATESV